MGVLAVLGRGGRRLAGTACCSELLVGTLCSAALLAIGCFPREDLSSYASSAIGEGGASQNLPPEPAGGDAGSLDGQGGTEMGPDTLLPLDRGDSQSGDVDAASSILDAGLLEDAGPPPGPDAGGDAGPIANACADTQGTLEPGTSVCLFFAALPRVTWQAADLACQSRNSTLVSIKTVARNDFLTALIGRTDVWVGAQDPGTNPAANAFVWRDLVAVDPDVASWATGEPDTVADQFCVAKTGELAAVAPPGPPAPWRDRPCSDLKAYVCEQTF